MTLARKRPRSLLWWPALLALTVTVASGGPAAPAVPDSMSTIPHFDKLVHFFVFGLLATLILRAFSSGTQLVVPVLVTIAVTSGFGLADELHQSTNPVRHFAWADWGADTAGAVVAVTAYLGWRRYRELLESDLKPGGRRALQSLRSRDRAASGPVPGTASPAFKRR